MLGLFDSIWMGVVLHMKSAFLVLSKLTWRPFPFFPDSTTSLVLKDRCFSYFFFENYILLQMCTLTSVYPFVHSNYGAAVLRGTAYYSLTRPPSYASSPTGQLEFSHCQATSSHPYQYLSWRIVASFFFFSLRDFRCLRHSFFADRTTITVLS